METIRKVLSLIGQRIRQLNGKSEGIGFTNERNLHNKHSRNTDNGCPDLQGRG